MKWILRIGGGLIAILLLAVVVLLVMGRRADAAKVSTSIEIAATPEQVWPWLIEGDKLKQWVSWLSEVRADGGAPSPVGDKSVWVMLDANNGNQPMAISATTTEFKRPERYAVTVSVPTAFTGDQLYQLTPLPGGHTRLDINGSYHFQMWLAQLMEPLIIPSARKKMIGDLAHLKSLAEAAPVTGAAR